MRILHVLTEPRGGGSAYALALSRAAALRGDGIAIATPRSFTAEFPELPLRANGIRRLHAASRAADVVHLHGVRAALVRPLLGGRSVIVTTHGLHALRAAHGPRRHAIRLVTRELLRDVDAIVCVSEADGDDVRAFGDSWRRRAHVVLNGVPPAPVPTAAQRAAARDALGISPDTPVALFLGRLSYQKNPQLAAEAAAIVREAIPELVLLMAGDGPLRPELELLDDEHVRVLGHWPDVPALLAAADVVVNTSRWEGLSLALLEALWRGRPLVVTDSPGNPEAVGDAGVVVGQDAEAVAAAVASLLRDPEVLRSAGERARRRAESLFDERDMIDRTLAIYDELAGRVK